MATGATTATYTAEMIENVVESGSHLAGQQEARSTGSTGLPPASSTSASALAYSSALQRSRAFRQRSCREPKAAYMLEWLVPSGSAVSGSNS